MTNPNLLLGNLLVRISAGDSDALADLCQGTRPALVAYVRKFVRHPWDVEEVIQDVYRQVWLNAAHYRLDRGAPMGWLYVIARSRALDKLRQSRSALSMPLLQDCFVEDGERQRVIGFEVGLVRHAISRLPHQQRRFILMAFIDGYSHSEIANLSGVPLGTVKGRIRTALLKMREFLTEGLAAAETNAPYGASRSGLQLVSQRSSHPHQHEHGDRAA